MQRTQRKRPSAPLSEEHPLPYRSRGFVRGFDTADLVGVQVEPYPAELRRVPRAIVLEARVGVDLDDQQRLGWRVVDERPE